MKLSNQRLNIAIICFAFSFVSISAQSKTIITHINIENKKNGAFVKLNTTDRVDPKFITGWTSDDNWFYITVHNAISDSGRIARTNLVFPVSKIQVHNARESTQIALKVDAHIENFEFYQSKSPPEILLSLRFPINDVASVLENERNKMEKNESYTREDVVVAKPKSKPVVVAVKENNESEQVVEATVISDKYKPIRTALYLAGTSLTIAGVALESNREEGLSWEIPTGLAIVAGTFLYDQFIHKTDKK